MLNKTPLEFSLPFTSYVHFVNGILEMDLIKNITSVDS